MEEWLEMATGVIAKIGFSLGLNREEMIEVFQAHNEAVKNTIPAEQLLVFEVKDGWEPRISPTNLKFRFGFYSNKRTCMYREVC